MTTKLALVLAAVLAGGLIATGCGDDDNGGGGNEPVRSQSGDTSGDGLGEIPADAEEAVKQCKETVADSVPNASSDLKRDLEEICDRAGEGDEDAVREAQKDLCLRLLEETVPDAAAREQAKASCDQVGAGP